MANEKNVFFESKRFEKNVLEMRISLNVKRVNLSTDPLTY